MPADDAASGDAASGNPDARPVLGDRFASALGWAIELHRGQTRKGAGVPYVAHLIEVAALVLHDGGTESEAIAGLLHDAIEDAGVRPKQIRKRYGRKVSKIVKSCTETIDGKLPRKSKAPRDASTWRARKQEAIDHLAAPDVPTPVLRVKAADALANARSIVADLRRRGPEVWQQFHAGAIDQLWYYRSLTMILVARHPGVLSDELRAAVTEMEELARWWFDVGDPQPGSD
jgi:(p)ppGpp synthase/HD superfamily hydrolase